MTQYIGAILILDGEVLIADCAVLIPDLMHGKHIWWTIDGRGRIEEDDFSQGTWHVVEVDDSEVVP